MTARTDPMTTEKFDLYQSITDSIIQAIEAGIARNSKPLWCGQGSSGMPRNYATGKRYSGVNVLVLWLAAEAHGYSDSRWLTFKQATAAGGTVRKGEHGSRIVYFEPLAREEVDQATGEIQQRTVPMLRAYTVFNAEQCEGLALEAPASTGFAGIDAADAWLRASGAVILEGGSKAYYSPQADTVRLPDRSRFQKAESFYAVAMHELGHWTGHKGRLARDFSGRFGDESYAMEELVAELSAAFCCADLGTIADTMPDHASYVDSWLRVLRRDKRAIFTAASQASKAHAFLADRLATAEAAA